MVVGMPAALPVGQQPQHSPAGLCFPDLMCSPPPGRSDGPLCAGAEAAGEGAAAAASGVSLGVAGQVWAVCQRRAVHPAADGPQHGRAALLEPPPGLSPRSREDVHPGQLAHQAQAHQHRWTPFQGAQKIHDLQPGSYRLQRPVHREPMEAPNTGWARLGGWWCCPALQGGAF